MVVQGEKIVILTMFDNFEDLFGEPMETLDFSYDPPEIEGVYICVEYDRYQEFLDDDHAFRLDGLKEVFVKTDPGDGKLFAVGEDFRIPEEEFEEYVWAFKTEYN